MCLKQALNERHYGALQGLNKSDIARQYGDSQVKIWRSYKIQPPKLSDDDKRHQSLISDIKQSIVDAANLKALKTQYLE